MTPSEQIDQPTVSETAMVLDSIILAIVLIGIGAAIGWKYT